jgi:hypothetical protein
MASPETGTDGRKGKGKKSGAKGSNSLRGRPPKDGRAKVVAGSKRRKKASADSDSGGDDAGAAAPRTVKPPRKKRIKRAEQEAQAMADDEVAGLGMGMGPGPGEEEDDIRIVFGGGEALQSPPAAKKKSKSVKKNAPPTGSAAATVKPASEKRVVARGKRGRKSPVGEGDSSAKNLFQQRAQSRRAILATEQVGGENEEEQSGRGRRQKVCVCGGCGGTNHVAAGSGACMHAMTSSTYIMNSANISMSAVLYLIVL